MKSIIKLFYLLLGIGLILTAIVELFPLRNELFTFGAREALKYNGVTMLCGIIYFLFGTRFLKENIFTLISAIVTSLMAGFVYLVLPSMEFGLYGGIGIGLLFTIIGVITASILLIGFVVAIKDKYLTSPSH